MGSKLSTCFSKKKTKKKERTQYSPKTQQEMYNARRRAKPIYPPLSSIPKEAPKRSVLPNGGLLYQPIHMDSEFNEDNRRYESARYGTASHFVNHYDQYDDGTFAVLARQPMNYCGIYRV